MIHFTEQGYAVFVYTDIREWLQEFYEVTPEQLQPDELLDASKSYMGFAEPDSKTIWVFIPEKRKLSDLKELVAHEIGHVVEVNYNNTPTLAEGHCIEEAKADFFMNFFMLVDKIVSRINKLN